MKRKIAVFTGSRSEFGFLSPVLRSLKADPRLEYYLLVSGAHLQDDFGKTLAEIEEDGFKVHAEVGIEMDGDSLYATAQAIGTGILSLSRTLDELRPHFLLVPGDRYEGFSAVIAASQMNIPVAHLEGGDYTEGGALDDSVRHAMTKLAHIHFTTSEQSAERVRKLGEEDWRVHNVGLPVLDLAAAGIYATPHEVEASLQIDPSRPVALFCQHSVATEFDQAEEQVLPSLDAMEALALKGYQVIITYPNNDAGGRAIIQRIRTLEKKQLPGVVVRTSLGRYLYHGVLNSIGRLGRGACVGNSSSGIKETAFFGCPVVNIGSRQRGRLRGTNVIDVPYDSKAIASAVERCVEDEEWRVCCRESENPYGAGNAGPQIAEVLATAPTGLCLLQKRMTY